MCRNAAAGRHSSHVATGSVSSWARDRMGTSDTVQSKTAEQLGTEAVVQQDKTKVQMCNSRLQHGRAASARCCLPVLVPRIFFNFILFY